MSVVIPAYNVSEFISEALESVFAQDFTDYEIIVVNDGSSDKPELERSLAPYAHRIIFLEQENKGISAARNAAIRIARGEYIAFLDGDDVWLPNKLSMQLRFMGEENCVLAYSNALYFGESPWPAGTSFMEKLPSSGKVTRESLLGLNCVVPCSTVVVRKELIIAAGMFDDDLAAAEDFDLWLRILGLDGATAGFQKTVLAKYRVRPTGISSNRIALHKAALRVLDKIQTLVDLNPRELAALHRTTQNLKALIGLERSKQMIVDGDFDKARHLLKQIEPLHGTVKLVFGRIVLRLYPQLLQMFYKKQLKPSVSSKSLESST
ncbi:MAG: glycosyltransferase family 2 protein [Pyrinomonadaceae bacterium]